MGRRSRKVCLLNTGIDPSPPPPPRRKFKKLPGQHLVPGHHPPTSKTPGPLPLNQEYGSAYAIFKHWTVNGCLLLLVCMFYRKVNCWEIFLSTQALELLFSPRHFINAVDANNLILCRYNADTLNICMKEYWFTKIIFDKMTTVRTYTIIPLYGFCIVPWIVPLWADQHPTTAFDGAIWYFAEYNVDILNICMKELYNFCLHQILLKSSYQN